MLNKVMLQGRLVADPELRHTGSGIPCCTFTLAVERDFKNNGEKQSDFFDIVTWRNTAEFVSKYWRKGKLMLVSGMLQKRNYTTQSGEKRYVVEVVAENVYFCGDNQNTAQSVTTPQTSGFVELGDDDDVLPF